MQGLRRPPAARAPGAAHRPASSAAPRAAARRADRRPQRPGCATTEATRALSLAHRIDCTSNRHPGSPGPRPADPSKRHPPAVPRGRAVACSGAHLIHLLRVRLALRIGPHRALHRGRQRDGPPATTRPRQRDHRNPGDPLRPVAGFSECSGATARRRKAGPFFRGVRGSCPGFCFDAPNPGDPQRTPANACPGFRGFRGVFCTVAETCAPKTRAAAAFDAPAGKRRAAADRPRSPAGTGARAQRSRAALDAAADPHQALQPADPLAPCPSWRTATGDRRGSGPRTPNPDPESARPGRNRAERGRHPTAGRGARRPPANPGKVAQMLHSRAFLRRPFLPSAGSGRNQGACMGASPKKSA